MAKTYNNVKELVKDLSDDKTFANNVLQEIKDKDLSKLLFSLRCSKNLTQKQLADKMNCTQSRISKIEKSYDKDLTMKDLLGYADALNLQLEIGYRPKNIKIVDLIKYHAFKIKQHLDTLAALTEKDESIFKGTIKFFDEVYLNITRFIQDSASKIKAPKISQEHIHISSPEKYMVGKIKDKNKKDHFEPV